jgi:hypothetical protein
MQVTVAAATPQAIPTLDAWGLLLLCAGLAIAALSVERRRRARAASAPRPFVP